MKIVKSSFLIACSVFVFVACSKEDTTNREKNLLIGKWRPTTEVDTDGEVYSYEPGCNNSWTFTESNITAEWDDDCNGSIDDSESAGYTLKNNRFDFNGANTDGEQFFLKSVNKTTLEINVLDAFDLEEPEGYVMSFSRIN